MATAQNPITDIGQYRSRHRGYSWHSGASDVGTPIGPESTKKPAESVTTPADVPFDVSGRQEQVPGNERRLSQSELYPVRHAFSPEHLRALRLLQLASGRCRRALDALGQDELLLADIEVQKVQVLLPELF